MAIRATRQVKAIRQIFTQLPVDEALSRAHQERLGIHPKSCKQRRAIRCTSVRLYAAGHHRVQAVKASKALAGVKALKVQIT